MRLVKRLWAGRGSGLAELGSHLIGGSLALEGRLGEDVGEPRTIPATSTGQLPHQSSPTVDPGRTESRNIGFGSGTKPHPPPQDGKGARAPSGTNGLIPVSGDSRSNVVHRFQ